MENILSYLETLINIKSKRGDEIIAFCPLHDDKHPSLSINIKTGKYQCWSGCVKGRKLETLIEKITGSKFQLPAAIIPLQIKLSDAIIQIPQIPILPLAIKNTGEQYLISRGLTQESILKWNIYHWQEKDSIVMPVNDIGFVRRSIKGKEYQYLPGTNISKTFFGLENFTFSEKKYIIIVEGAFDVIWLHQNGYQNSLGLLSSNLSANQRKILLSLGSCIYLMLDADKAGREAAKKIANELKGDFIVRICKLPNGKDPNDCSSQEIEESIKSAKMLMEDKNA